MFFSWKTTLAPESVRAADPHLRVLLISLDCTPESTRTPMLAPAFLVAHARAEPIVRQRVEFDIRQFWVQEAIESMLEEILSKNYDAICFSCYVWNFAVYEQLLPVLRRLRPNAVFIMGGPQLLNQETEIFQAFPELDILVYRDGEPAFRDLMVELATGRRDWSLVGGILVRHCDQLLSTRDRKKSVHFADIASPYLEGVITGRHDNLYIETYRGCPYTCAFCAWGGDEGPKNDMLPIERISRELGAIREMGAHTLGFFDSNFNQPPHRAEAIMDRILELDFKIVGMSVFAQTMREELAAKMAKVHTMVGVGLQSSDPGVNMVMNRRFREEKMILGIKLLKKYNLNFVLQVIVGLPGDTYASIASSIEYAVAHGPPTIDVFRLMVLPGTEYRRRAEEFELVYAPRPYHYVVSNYSMGPAEINRAERMGQAINVFYNRPAAREQMLRQVAENNESIVAWGEAMGNFMETFALFDRAELRKGDLIRGKDDPQLLRILSDFRRFRSELSLKMAREELAASKSPIAQGRRLYAA